MHDDVWFRGLYRILKGEDEASDYDTPMMAWLHEHPDTVDYLETFKQRPAAKDDEKGDLMNLYALSRILDEFTTCYAPGIGETRGSMFLPHLDRDECFAFCQAVGMEEITDTTFHPFLHEIVTVVPAPDPDAPITFLARQWPGFMLGDMLVLRMGVSVSGGVNVIDRTIAEKSHLFFAYVRAHRPVLDQSQGWGHNSQWGTCFRRDYRVGNRIHYNIDGDTGIESDTMPNGCWAMPELSHEERREIVRFRHFIRCAKPDLGLWPYSTWLTEDL
jgi:hypothetical protein